MSRQVFVGSLDVLIDDAGRLAVDAEPRLSAAFTVTAAATSKTLAALAVVVPADVRRVQLVPHAAGVHWAIGSASAATCVVPTGGLLLPIDKAVADAVQLYAAGDTKCDVVVFA